MDWKKIKHRAGQFDRLLKKELTVADVDVEVSDSLLMMIYADARWIADMPKEHRQDALNRVHDLCREDVKDIAALILRGEIP